MGKRRNIVVLFIVGIFLVTVLGGCGSSPSDSGQTNVAAITQGQESTGTTQEQSDTQSSLNGKVKFACWDYELNKYDKTIIEAFRESYPGISVDVQDIPSADFSTKLSVMLAGGDGCGCVLSSGYNVLQFGYREKSTDGYW